MILELVYKIRDFIWDKIFENRLKYNKLSKNYEFTFSAKILYILIYGLIDFICDIVWFLTRRLICHIKGCDIYQTIIDDNILYEEECKRCGNIVNYSVKEKDRLIRK